MAILIQAIGDYFEVDDNGYLVNPSDWLNVPSKWHGVIEAIKDLYIHFYGAKLHSLYLRGSIVRGSFIEGVSDLDIIGLIKQERIKWSPVSFNQEIYDSLETKFPFAKDLELMISSFTNDFPTIYPALAMVFKTQSLCIFGEDVSLKIKPFKIDDSLVIHHKWLEKDLLSFLAKECVELADYKAIMKTIIRSGFELVLEREKKFTLDLYPAIQSFSRHYPNQKENMEAVLFYYLNPGEQPMKQRELLVSFGAWLVKETKEVLK